jgi:hypothetical protein
VSFGSELLRTVAMKGNIPEERILYRYLCGPEIPFILLYRNQLSLVEVAHWKSHKRQLNCREWEPSLMRAQGTTPPVVTWVTWLGSGTN